MRKVVAGLFLFVLFGFLVPEPRIIPVDAATEKDWNKNTFWFYPWGSSIVHKGIDIFGKKGTPVIASTHILIIYSGNIKKGGNVILGLGPKWRLHYFAHMESTSTNIGNFIMAGEKIGTLGDSGNALNKPAHLHFSLLTLFPYFWKIDNDIQGGKKAIYLNPDEYFRK
ncbi:MAG: M23 family metallopeptidase [Cellvibrionaceae bacterium]